MGRSSGQRVNIHNCTPFTLHLESDKAGVKVVCGESWHHPAQIPPKKNRDDPNIEGLSYLQNNGCTGVYGSEIIYTYQIMETPDTHDHSTKWLLRIYSIGAYSMENACFVAQVLECDTSGPGTSEMNKIIRAQISWRDATSHNTSHPKPNQDGNIPNCPFTIEILREPEKFPEGGEAFYKIEFKISMKALNVDSQKIEKCEEIEDEEDLSVVIQQKLLPGGRNEIVYEHTQEKYKCMKRKCDDKWGRTLEYDHNFEWGINLSAEKPVKAEVSLGGKHGLEIATTREHLMSTDVTDTYTVKRVHKWTYAEDVAKEKSIKITIKKVTYRITYKFDGKIIGYKEKYEYIYEPTFMYHDSVSEVSDEVEHKTKA